MLVIGDDAHPYDRFPWVTLCLIMANVVAFSFQLCLGREFTESYSMVAAEVVQGRDSTPQQDAKFQLPQDRRRHAGAALTVPPLPSPLRIYVTLFTHMFLHAGFFHLLGNMWFLWIFGRNVETGLGHARFLIYYLIGGLAGSLAQLLSDTQSTTHALGASGAIACVMGSYLAINPFNKLKLWFGWWIGVIEVPAVLFLGLWALLQFLSARHTQPGHSHGGVAYWAHLGGFAAGLVLIWVTVAYLRMKLVRAEEGEELATAAANNEVPVPEHVPPEDFSHRPTVTLETARYLRPQPTDLTERE